MHKTWKKYRFSGNRLRTKHQEAHGNCKGAAEHHDGDRESLPLSCICCLGDFTSHNLMAAEKKPSHDILAGICHKKCVRLNNESEKGFHLLMRRKLFWGDHSKLHANQCKRTVSQHEALSWREAYWCLFENSSLGKRFVFQPNNCKHEGKRKEKQEISSV